MTRQTRPHRRRRRRLRRVVLGSLSVGLVAALAACGQGAGSTAQTYPSRNLEIMIPAAPGGGWDLTGRSMQQVLDNKIIDVPVQVSNVDAGGAVALSPFISQEAGDPHQLMVTGLVMLGALEIADAPVRLSKTTPIATLTAEPEAIVVPTNSKYKTLTQLMKEFKHNPQSITWGGGSLGGSDHLVVGLLAQVAGIDPSKIDYVSYSGGGEAKAGILSGDVDVGVSGVSEFESLIASGKMRLLAVSSPKPVEVAGEQATTIRQAGYDVDFMNWRGVVAPPDLSADQRRAITTMIDEMHDSKAWQQILKKQGWQDFYKTGKEARSFYKSETKRVQQLLREFEG